ncbi:MAG: sugar ABC transporter substrate-binding protein [Caldilineaceae bacterium]|nr:sugar ABC transporter substrate-binding protein [Caldilineaceae bacterium]
MKKVRMLSLTLLVIAGLVMAACGGAAPAPAAGGDSGGGEAAAEPVTITYWLWDANQLPPYQQCADNFMAANPNIAIEITQSGWGDYWNNIQTGMVAGTAPDVFTDHLAKYPEFAAKEQLMDIQPFVEGDGIDLSVYLGELADLWARDGKRFGLPKDWDTIAIAYNTEAIDAAGVTVDDLNNLTWNPEDGGTFGEMLAQLSVDENGNNGLSPDFDKSKVAQYGLIINGAGGPYGQTEWSWLTNTTGWTFNDGLYDTKYNYDDPRFIASIQWVADQMAAGYIMPQEQVSSLGGGAAFESGLGALHANGSWMIGELSSQSSAPVGFARLPQGPEGRKSMFNGLADSIWVGTEHPDEAWQWVKYLASQECADVVGEAGVVFPAQQSAVDKALTAYAAKGLDVSAFTDQALEEGGTFLFPVTDHASEVTAIMDPVMQSIMLGQTDAQTALTAAAAEVNALFQ